MMPFNVDSSQHLMVRCLQINVFSKKYILKFKISNNSTSYKMMLLRMRAISGTP